MFHGGKCKYIPVLFGIILTSSVPISDGYKHVVFMHGIFSGASEFHFFRNLIQQYHPGTPVTLVDLFTGVESLVSLQKQVHKISDLLRPVLTNKSSEGTVLICFSQGGLVCRGLLATINHNVDTFISISSPLAGQFGDTDYLKYFYPKFIKKNIYKYISSVVMRLTPTFRKVYLTNFTLFYSKFGQDISFANYWNDPSQQPLFEKYSNFLAVLNNQSIKFNPKSYEFRNNFLRLKNMVLVGGPDDGVITPWQSSHFGMYNSSEIALPMEDQKWYLNDAFGLKTLNSQGRIHKYTIPRIAHVKWCLQKQVFEMCIKPWLT